MNLEESPLGTRWGLKTKALEEKGGHYCRLANCVIAFPVIVTLGLCPASSLAMKCQRMPLSISIVGLLNRWTLQVFTSGTEFETRGCWFAFFRRDQTISMYVVETSSIIIIKSSLVMRFNCLFQPMTISHQVKSLLFSNRWSFDSMSPICMFLDLLFDSSYFHISG